MEFIIDRNSKTLKEFKIDNYHCNSCNKKTKLNLFVKGGFVSVFLIPMVPIKKDYLIIGDNCKKKTAKKTI